MAKRIKILVNRNWCDLEKEANQFLEKLGDTAICGSPRLTENDELYMLTICYCVPDLVDQTSITPQPKN